MSRSLLGFCVMLTAFVNLFGVSMSSYDALASALRRGECFTIVVDFQECTGKPGMPIGYFAPKAMMLVPAKETVPERILTSDLHFSNHSGKPLYEYVKYTFNADNSVTIETTFYDAQDFKVMGPVHAIQCTLGKGIEIYN